VDRLPYGRFHRRVLICSALAFIFEVGDQTATGLVAPSLPKHLGTDLTGVAFVVSAMYLGLLVGSILAGQGDRLGRRALLTWGLVIMSIFSGLSALSVNVEMLVLLRFLAGVGLGLTYISMIVYLAEVFPARRRAFALGLSIGIASIGAIVLTMLARAVVPMGEYGWRVVFAIGLLGLLAVPASRKLPESPRWLIWRHVRDSCPHRYGPRSRPCPNPHPFGRPCRRLPGGTQGRMRIRARESARCSGDGSCAARPWS
jgi:putative MFS transporter